MSIFGLLNLVQLQWKNGVWINSPSLNNLGRPEFEIGSAHENLDSCWESSELPVSLSKKRSLPYINMIYLLALYNPLDN